MLKSLKNMIWVDANNAAPAQAPSPAQAPAPMPTPTPTSAGITPIFADGGASQMDADSVLDTQSVMASIESHIAQNPDFLLYKSFQEKVDALQSVIADEGTRFKAAGATTGISGAQLVDSVLSAKAILEEENSNFEGTFCATAERQIADETIRVESMDSEIAELNARLVELVKIQSETQESITKRKTELAKARIDFASIKTTLTARYEAIAGKIQQYL